MPESTDVRERLANRRVEGVLQQLSETEKGHVVGDETSIATGTAFPCRVANDVARLRDRFDEAPTAALLARHLYGDG